MPISAYLPITLALAAAAGLSVATARVAADRVEANALTGISRELAQDGIDWAAIEVDGLQVALSGTAPDEAARFAAISAAGRVVDAARVIDRMEVRAAESVAPPAYSVEILRNVDGISVIGLIPATSDRDGMIAGLGALADAPVADLLEEGPYPAPALWEDAVTLALAALRELPRAKVSITGEEVRVTAMAASAERRDEVTAALREDVPEGLSLALDIAAPRPVIAPFTVRFVIDEAGPRFDACAAEDDAARRRILAAARAAGWQGEPACPIGLGAPARDWGGAVAAGINALDRLGGGAITFSDADVSILARHSVPLPLFDREVGELERVLGADFSLTARRDAPPEDAVATDAGAGEPEFLATLSPEGEVQLRGRLPDARTRGIVEAYAHGHFGVDTTYGAARLDPDLPEGWALRVLAALDALAHLNNGSVTVRPDLVRIAGDTGSDRASAEIAGLLGKRLGEGARFEIDVSYVETLDPMYGLPTPEECVARLEAVQKVRKITFEPGSSTIDGAGLEIVEQLAEILRDCQTVPIEIAGHTDSQGRESMNLRLSQERADAVLNAILARRVLTRNLNATGYGEARPIADNDTEAGREANRRIEFTLLSDAPAPAADPKEEADGSD